MAKVDLMPGIESMSGRLGTVVFKTYRRRDGKIETRAYTCKRSERSNKPSKAEMGARSRFGVVSKAVHLILSNTKLSAMIKKQLWHYCGQIYDHLSQSYAPGDISIDMVANGVLYRWYPNQPQITPNSNNKAR